MTEERRKPTSRERAVEWVFSQGTSTVLLLAQTALIAYAMGYGAPWAYKEMRSWHADIEEKQSNDRKVVADALLKSNASTNQAIGLLTSKVVSHSSDVAELKSSIRDLVMEIKKDRVEKSR